MYFTNHFKACLLGRKCLIVTDHRALVWLYGFKDAESMISRWFEMFGVFNFEKKQNAGETIPDVDCPPRVETEVSGIRTFVTALTKTDTGIENTTTNPWQLLQNVDRKSFKLKQKGIKLKPKSLFGWKKNRDPTSNNWQSLWKNSVFFGFFLEL